MSEYIVEMPKEPAKVVHDGWNVHIEWQYKQREKIVRCRDCDYYDHWDASGPYREKHVCGYWDYLEIKPDGFCAWGEQKQ